MNETAKEQWVQPPMCQGTACGCITLQFANKSVEVVIPPVYLAQTIIYSLELPLSLIGMILCITFICRKKTNFLVRVFVYSAIPITILLGVFWLSNISAFKPDSSLTLRFCQHLFAAIYVDGSVATIWIVALQGCTVSIILFQTVCRSCCNCCSICRRDWRNRSSLRACLEILFVVMTIVIPIVTWFASAILQSVIAQLPTTDKVSAVILNISLYGWEYVIFIIAIPMILSFISTLILVIWFCVRRRQITRRGTMLKEIGVFLGFMLITILVCLLLAFLMTDSSIDLIGVQVSKIFVSTILALSPLCVFAYMRYSFRTSPREVRQAVNVDGHDFQTAGLQTAPDSTRVSLPSDTAAHAPNFLSPSTAEPTDVTPLLN